MEAHEAALEAVMESVSEAFYALDADWRYVVFNRAAEEYFGVSRTLVLGRRIWDIFPQGRGTDFERNCYAAMEEGVSTTYETSSRYRPDRVVELTIMPLRGGGVAVRSDDVTDRRRAEEAMTAALKQREEILESISDAFYAVDADFRFTYVNRVAEALWGRRREDLIGKSFLQEFPQAAGSLSHEAHLTAARERRVVRLEAISPLLGRWLDISISPSQSGLSVYFRDITERKAAEERQRLLVNELNHRVKNALATVQAIAAQSLRGEDVPDEARERFLDRLIALARANDVLVSQSWEGASLAAIAAEVARPHAAEGESERFHIEGPNLALSPKAATSLALALHELAPNAAKYGALSSPAGQVSLAWRLDGDGAERRVRIEWRESGGPLVSAPARQGFGTRLVQRGLAGELHATVNLDYAPTGLVCTVVAPLGEGVREAAA
jgi:PAS domain S-box-containing protein